MRPITHNGTLLFGVLVLIGNPIQIQENGIGITD
jgi:hypothetical protein